MGESPHQTPRAIHHALLNHVAVISTYTELLRDSNLDEDQQELLSELSRSAAQAHALATELSEKLKLHAAPEGDPYPEGGST